MAVVDYAVISDDLRWATGGLCQSRQVPWRPHVGLQLRIRATLLEIKIPVLRRLPAGNDAGLKSHVSDEMGDALKESGVSDVQSDASETGLYAESLQSVLERNDACIGLSCTRGSRIQGMAHNVRRRLLVTASIANALERGRCRFGTNDWAG